ncbi:Hypothetical predicted protein [Pelobates cultripes]|uniref:Uncharacterized protein n=1 Tax=Pelobates cultripes TaxID=61616 RepID=A0AAD1RPL7_PELCU|nr:Hypothetical predicted protein [Pelobates cultripes]
MGRTKRVEGSQTPRGNPPSTPAGPMDGFLTPATTTRQEAADPNMADSPTGTSPESGETTLADISAEIRALAANVVTKDDLRGLSETLHAAIHTEVTALRADLVTQGSRLQQLENTTQAHTAQAEASNLAITRQGNMLLTLRRHTEDLDNRGRRSNIRVRGIPESAGDEDVEALLRALFREISNWILNQPEQRPGPQTPRQQRRRREETPRRPVARRQLEPGDPEDSHETLSRDTHLACSSQTLRTHLSLFSLGGGTQWGEGISNRGHQDVPAPILSGNYENWGHLWRHCEDITSRGKRNRRIVGAGVGGLGNLGGGRRTLHK